MEAAGIDRRRECLREVALVEEKVNRLPRKPDIAEERKISPEFVEEYFDSWKQMHSEFLDSNGISEDEPPERFLIGELEYLRDIRNYTDLVSPSDLKRSVFDQSVFLEQFGSWSKALEAIDVDAENEIAEMLNRIDEQVEGRIQEDHIRNERSLDEKVVESVFGSTEAAIASVYESADAIEETHREDDDEDSETPQEGDEPRESEEERSEQDGSSSIDLDQLRGEVESSALPSTSLPESADPGPDTTRVASGEDGIENSTDSEDENEISASQADSSPVEEAKIFWDDEVTPVPLADETEHERVDQPEATTQDTLDRKINQWKSQCLDLARRNQLIDFTETQSKSLPFIGQNCIESAELFASGTV